MGAREGSKFYFSVVKGKYFTVLVLLQDLMGTGESVSCKFRVVQGEDCTFPFCCGTESDSDIAQTLSPQTYSRTTLAVLPILSTMGTAESVSC